MGAQDGLGNVLCGGPLGTNEKKDFSFDVTGQLLDASGVQVDSIVSHEWSIKPDDATLSGKFTVDNTVGIYVETPRPETPYRLTAKITTNSRVLEAAWVIGGVQIAPPA